MTLHEFKSSLKASEPPAGLSIHAQALWYAGKGDWNQAHELVQDLNDKFSAQIHAFLHRQEGDISNAHYWYARANTKMPDYTLEQEWDHLAMSQAD